jgi:hypothetical protein
VPGGATSPLELLVTFAVFALVGALLFVLLAVVTKQIGGRRPA